ncbi:ppa [Drosophila busckii]|uniref:Ppa n=1 Tax=Drosophila busckii TaxID=30019 RepID=A0A0M3QVH2_DROBS|nr:ppa [Drosophila busckii]
MMDLSLCKQITDTILLIAWGQKKLRYINLRSYWHISEQGIGHLVGFSRNTAEGLLCSLSLNQCQITDQGILKIAKSLQELKNLYIGQCSRITDMGS